MPLPFRPLRRPGSEATPRPQIDPSEFRGPAEYVAPYSGYARTLAREHPALVLTLGYLFLTVVGLCYDFWYYRRFGIDILEFADVPDFLLAAMRQPMVLLLSGLSAAGFWYLYVLDHWFRRRFPRIGRLYARGYMATRFYRASEKAFLIFGPIFYFAAIFTPYFAFQVADRVRAGGPGVPRAPIPAGATWFALGKDGPTAPTPRMTPAEGLLVGATSRYVFLYSKADRRTYVVPAEQVPFAVVAPRDEQDEKD